MIISRKLLKDYIPNINQVGDNKINDHLITIGLEIEKHFHAIQPEKLTIGKILEIRQHTYSEEHWICLVQIKPTGEKNNKLTIVCKKNAIDSSDSVNKYVIVALKGCEINKKIIVETDIEGITSEGMLCTYNQLTENNSFAKIFSKDENTIILLDFGIIGDNEISKYIAMDDYLIEVSVPYNRCELHGVKYVAQELAASLGQRYIGYKNNTNKVENNWKCPLKINNQDAAKIEFFGGVGITCNENIESPWILKGILLNHNLKPEGLIQDVCKLATIHVGLPLFLCDLDKTGNSIFAKCAEHEYKFTGTDNADYTATVGDIVIVNNSDQIVSLAGIAVNKNFEVDKNSKNIFAIIGHYDKVVIAGTTNRLGIASNLFTKEISLTQCNDTAIKLCSLLDEFSNSNTKLLSAKLTHGFNVKKYGKEIRINYKKIATFLGFNISKRLIKSILTRLGFVVKSQSVFPPAYRTDIKNWQDVTEEILKLVEISQIPKVEILNHTLLENDTNKYDKINEVINLLTNLQFTNVVTKNLCSLEDAESFNYFGYQGPLKLNSQQKRSYLRLSLTHNLLKILQENHNMKINLMPIFEIQKIYSNFYENHHLGIVLPVTIFPIYWKANEQLKNDIFLAKGIVEKIIKMFGFKCEFKKVSNKWMAVAKALSIYVYDNLIGYVGLISRKWLNKYDLDMPVYCIELNIEQLLNSINTNVNRNGKKVITNVQAIIRDMTVTLKDKNQDYHFLETVVNSIEEIETWKLISVFQKDKNSDVSYTIRYELNQNSLYEKTLNGINLAIKSIYSKLMSEDIKIK